MKIRNTLIFIALITPLVYCNAEPLVDDAIEQLKSNNNPVSEVQIDEQPTELSTDEWTRYNEYLLREEGVDFKPSWWTKVVDKTKEVSTKAVGVVSDKYKDTIRFVHDNTKPSWKSQTTQRLDTISAELEVTRGFGNNQYIELIKEIEILRYKVDTMEERVKSEVLDSLIEELDLIE